MTVRSYISLALLAMFAQTNMAAAAVTAATGYIYSTQLLGNLTQGCLAAGSGGTFVGIGPSFTPNAQSIVLAKESGDLRLVASGFNSIGDCAYDRVTDVLYVTDNADNDDFMITSPFGALSGDTVFAIPSASTASGLSAPGLELLPPDSLAFASSLTMDASGDLFVSDSVGGGAGTVVKIVGSTPSVFVPGLDWSGGVAISPATGNLFVAQTLSSFDNRLDQFDAVGVAVPPVPFAGPSTTFGSYDLAFNSDGRLLITGAFAGDVLSFDAGNGTSTPFVSGLNFATGVTVDPFTHRVQLLSGTFPVSDENKSLHRLTPIDQLAAGGGANSKDCLHEAYGVQLVDGQAECTDGGACDSDGVVNDACVFPVGFCLNVDDPDLAACDNSNDITELTISAKPASAAITAAAAQASSALPLTGSSCFFSDGYYVPVKITGSGTKKDGQGKLKVKVAAADGRTDSDSLKLVCHPAP